MFGNYYKRHQLREKDDNYVSLAIEKRNFINNLDLMCLSA